MTRSRLIPLVLTLVVSLPAATLTAEAPPAAGPAVSSTPGAFLCATTPAGTGSDGTEALPLASLAECTADCEDGTTVTCSGSSCSAQDQDCDAGDEGFCESDMGEGFCDPCNEPEPVFCKSQGQACSDNSDCLPCSNGDPCACLGGTCACA